MIAFNLNRGTDRVRLFEAGDIFVSTETGTAEPARICFAATAPALNNAIPQGSVLDQSEGSTLDLFRSLKGDVETVLVAFEHGALHFEGNTSEYYLPGRSARVLLNGSPIAEFGLLHPEVAAKRKLRQEVFVAEINAEKLYKLSLRTVRYEPLPKYPGVERDFSFVFPDKLMFGQIETAIMNLEIPEQRCFSAVEIFRGGSVPAGSYSVLLRAQFQSHERTLREEEVNDWSARIVTTLTSLGGTQRA
jgi:phenylalanyl-tRNA synthetase beta chain